MHLYMAEQNSSRRGLARAAGLIGIGGMASRVLGLVREMVITAQFGTSEYVAAFNLARTIPTAIYDFLVGGLLSSALVPVFSEYATRDDDHRSLWQLAGLMLSLVAIVLLGFTLLMMGFAPQIMPLLVVDGKPELQATTAILLRFIAPSMFFLGLSGVFTGLLYALKRFTFVSFTAAIYNIGIIIGALVLSRGFVGDAQIIGLALGMVLGSVLHIALLLPDLWGLPLRWQVGKFWEDAGLRRIVKLYIPVALSFVVSNIGILIDRRLATSTAADQTIPWMSNATTLIQFPLGIVAATISLAVLPNLSRMAAVADWSGFRDMLKLGMRLVLVLMIPATVGLFILAQPIVRLLFERGAFVSYDTFWTASALQVYLLGMTFAAIDQVLIIAFYSRQDTWTPAIVGMVAVGIYLAVALPLIEPLQMQGLVLANSLQHFSHALIMLFLIQWRLGDVISGIPSTVARIVLASVGMAGVILLLLPFTQNLMPGLIGTLLAVAIPAGLGAVVYGGLVLLLRVPEATLLGDLVLRRLRPK
jgi:putative peptidoglycan lipid II flippase